MRGEGAAFEHFVGHMILFQKYVDLMCRNCGHNIMLTFAKLYKIWYIITNICVKFSEKMSLSQMSQTKLISGAKCR